MKTIARRVEYVAKNSDNENVRVGRVVMTGGRCAVLERHGRPITAFTITAGQQKSLKAGKPINITNGAIHRSRLWGCGGWEVGPQGRTWTELLGGKKRRKPAARKRR